MGSFFVAILDAITPLGLRSDEDLAVIREEYRQRHCAGDTAGTRMIEAIDGITSRRYRKAHKGEEPGFPVPREHGWYLPNDD